MKKIIEVLRLKHEAKLSHEKIARACGISKGAVSHYISLTRAKGLGWPLPGGVDEAALEAMLFPARERPSRHVEPDYFQIHQELKRKGVTLQLLWSEYAAIHEAQAYRYSQYCNRYRQWRARLKRSMRQQHRAGEKAFIDYCGPTVDIIDRHSGEVRSAQVFVGVLGASSYTYAEMAAHYGTAVLPAQPYKPKDKAKVAVQLVERWILARLRHRTFFTLADAILDRLLHGAHRLNLRGESMRKMNAGLTDRDRSE